MKLQSLAILAAPIPYALGFPHLVNFPEHRSLAGLSREEVRAVARSFSSTPGAQPLPPAINDTSAKLVYDEDHPFVPDRPGDIRGPCPGLNTLASHGYINRSGVATPAEIITAVQEGFNMGWGLASFVTYGAFIVDGNHLTNLMSIGANTTADDQFTPGLNIHGNFEGDVSTTRGDFYFGNNFNFNETLFDQLVDAANLVGDGLLTVESVSLQKAHRINDSIARNPTFSFDSPRYLTAYAETTFPLAFFVSNQTVNTTLNGTVDNARSFFDSHKYPDEFYRRQGSYDFPEVRVMFRKIYDLIQVPPGRNEGAGNFVVNPEDDGSTCYGYHRQVNLTAQLYPNPTPELEAAIKTNIATFYQTLQNPTCQQLFPFGHASYRNRVIPTAQEDTAERANERLNDILARAKEGKKNRIRKNAVMIPQRDLGNYMVAPMANAGTMRSNQTVENDVARRKMNAERLNLRSLSRKVPTKP